MFEHLDDPRGFEPRETFRRRAMDRGRRLRARRRLTAVAATAAVAGVLAAAVLATGPSGNGRDDLRTGPAGEDADPRIAVPEPSLELPVDKLVQAPQGLTATPAVGHQEGGVVTLHLDPPAGPGEAAGVCATEILDHLDDWLAPAKWCGQLSAPASATEATIPIERRLPIDGGMVDCADAPGRCLLVVSGGVGQLRYAPLVMPEVQDESQAEVRVHGADGPVEDGREIRIEADGFTSGTTVLVVLCSARGCDESARAVSLDADADGRFALDFRVYQEILFRVPATEVDTPSTSEWTSCSPCRLQVGDGFDVVSLPLELAPTDDPILPWVTVDGIDGPLEAGGHVRVTGTGFQPGSAHGLWLAWCPEEVGGDEIFLPAGDDLAGCQMPDEGGPRTTSPDSGDGPSQPTFVANEDGYTVDDDGTFTIERFPLPDAGTVLAGRSCTARVGSCSFVWTHPNQLLHTVLPPEQDRPLDLSG